MIWCDDCPLLQFYLLNLLHKVLGVFEVVWWLAYQEADEACKFFSHPIGDGAPAGHYGPEEGAKFMDFGKAIKHWGDYTGWV